MKSAFGWMTSREPMVWAVFLALAIGGAFSATSLPSGIYPEVEFPRIVVVARAGEAPPDVTQVELTRPLEASLATVLGMQRMRSKTIRGACELSLQFTPGSDMQLALQLVQAAVAEARGDLPAGADITVERLTTTSFPVLTFNLSGPIDPRYLRELADFVVKPALAQVGGVGRVDVLGGDVREVEVEVYPERAAALGLTPFEIAEALARQSVVRSVGRYEEAHALVTVMVASEPADLAALRALPIAQSPGGGPVPLDAVALVREGAEDRTLRVSGPGDNHETSETINISVARLPGASTPDVVAAVLAAADSLARTLPSGARLTPVYDQATLVDESIASVRDAILIGIGLCVLVIALFLRELRAGAVAALTVPLALGVTFLPMALAGQTLNLMSLGGLAVAIGLVIDDAIVVVEGIGRRLDAGAAPREAASEAVRALLGPLVGTTLTTVVVFVPLAWLDGVVGRFFGALATTLSIAVLLSLAVSVTVVPLASARWLRIRRKRQVVPTGRSRSRRPAERVGRDREASLGTSDTATSAAPRGSTLGRAYTALVRPFLRFPWLGVALAAGLVALGVVSAGQVGSGFLPTMDEGAFVLDYVLPAGTSLAETDRALAKVDAILESIPEVVTFTRRTGAELGPAAATQVNTGDIMVRLKASRDRERGVEEIISDVRARVEDEVPETRVEFVQVLQDVLDDLSGNPRPLEIELFGDDYRVLRRLAGEVAARVEPLEGLVDLDPGFEGLAPELRLDVDADAALRIGKTPADLAARLDAALHGTVAAVLRRPDRPVGVRVRYPDAVRFDPRRILDLPLVLAPGRVTRISAVAHADPRSSDVALEREGQRAVMVLTADHEDRDLGELAADVQAHLADLRLPPGYRLVLGGQYRSQQETVRQLATVMGFGLVAVLIVLLVQFRRARLAVAVLLTVPLSVVGALATLWLTGIPLDASSLMGCVLLVGLVVKNGILLLEQHERNREAAMPVRDALIAAGAMRVRPIVMTTVATIAGLAPLALGLGAGAEIQRPLAVAVIGGLALSTLTSLFVLPSLALLFEGRRDAA